MGLTAATLKNSFGICGLVYPVTWLSSSPTDLTFDQTTSPGGFSFSEQEITTETTGSQREIINSE